MAFYARCVIGWLILLPLGPALAILTDKAGGSQRLVDGLFLVVPVVLTAGIIAGMILAPPRLRSRIAGIDEEAKNARCAICGYSLEGLRAARCPECGEAVDEDE